jgi:hypothetical protein
MGWVQVDALLARVDEERERRLGPAVRHPGEARVLEAVARGEARRDQGRPGGGKRRTRR